MLHKKNKRYEKDRTYFRTLHGFFSVLGVAELRTVGMVHTILLIK